MSNIESRTEPGTHDRFKMRPLSIRLLLKITSVLVFQQTAKPKPPEKVPPAFPGRSPATCQSISVVDGKLICLLGTLTVTRLRPTRSRRLVDNCCQHHFIVMVIKAKLAETSIPSLAPRSSSTTPFSLRNLTPETPAATAAPPPTPV
jgi:hypothetical protein